jgi:hypothetical protein
LKKGQFKFDGAGVLSKADDSRLSKQHETIRDFMLGHGEWKTLGEIATALDYPEASVSAQLRHLRKGRFGGYFVDREHVGNGLFRYRVRRPMSIPTASVALSRKTLHDIVNACTKLETLAAIVITKALADLDELEAAKVKANGRK